MHPSIERLLRVQEVDSQIIFLREAIRLRPRECEDEQRKLREAKELLESFVAQVKKLRLESDRRELDVRGFDAEIAKLKVALNTAKTNAEYTILREQIKRQEAARGQAEEDVLMKLSEIDELQKRQKELEERVASAEKAYRKKEEEVRQVVAGLTAELNEHLRRRAGLLEGIDKDHLQIYEKLLGHYKDFAIARVEANVCPGCHMSVTQQEVNLLMQGELVRCKYCTRLLCLS
jgi:predicted  nucleic acid-binding Zn-ribbon protein